MRKSELMVCFRVCQETKCSFITGFRELKQIKSLIYFPGSFLTFPFHGGVVPILRVHGYSLECLHLPPVPSGKVHLIIECCPNIRRLYLSIEDRPSDIAEQEVNHYSIILQHNCRTSCISVFFLSPEGRS